MTSISDDAVTMFAEGYNCAQSVLTSCGQRLGLRDATAIAVAQALGGGLSRSGNVCGAVSGALMAVGLKCSMKDAKDIAAKEEAYRLGREILARFRAQHQAINCRDLLGFDVSTPEKYQEAVKAGVFKNLCPAFIKSAGQIAEDVLGIH
jgi:C_GCAxxG_C_C family probable redox protein